jgi:hypothetical protein
LRGYRTKLHDDETAAERLKGIFREAHHRIEAAEIGRISQAEMAVWLGISQGAYVEYLHRPSPAGFRVSFDVLAIVMNDETIALLRRWREGCMGNGKNRDGG